MNAQAANAPRWITASFDDSASTMPMELSALGAHVDHCNGCRSRWFTLRCTGDAIHGFVATRFVTTLVMATAVLAAAAVVS
jgi:hypothetical protein